MNVSSVLKDGLESKINKDRFLVAGELARSMKRNIIQEMDSHKKAPSGNRSSVRRKNPISDCPLTAAMAAVGGKWKMLIIYWLSESPKHFAAIRKVMPGISQKVLTQQLRELADDGIVLRNPTGIVPAPVEYSLTDYGRSLLPLIESVKTFGRSHIEKFREPESSNTIAA